MISCLQAAGAQAVVEATRRYARQAVGAEQKEVDELRFKLEFELSQTLADKKDRENKALEGS